MGSVLTMLFITVVDSNSYGYAGFLFVFSNVFFGSSIVFYNAYLPFLVEAHEDLAEASKKGLPASELEAKKAQLSDEMSSHGFAYGYGTSVCLLIISFIIQLFVPNSKENNNVSDRICIFISGIWWLAVSQYSFKHLLPRPGQSMFLFFILVSWLFMSMLLYVCSIIKFATSVKDRNFPPRISWAS